MDTSPSLQNFLDTVVEHLLNGGVKSEEDRQCLYRGPNGAKCFLGLCIPDDMYDPAFDFGEDTVTCRVLKAVWGLPKDSEKSAALVELQHIHDSCINWRANDTVFNANGWAHLKKWATANNLTWPEEAP